MAYGRTNASGGAIGAWRFAFADVLPEAVLHNTFLAITGIPAPGILLSDVAPEQPEDGQIWFQINDPADGLVMSSTAVPFRVLGAYQWSATNGEWTLLTAYYTYLGTWRQLSGLPPIGTALADCSWAQIDRIGKAGKAEEYFCVGDTKDIVLSTAETITLQIIGFNHDDLAVAGSGKAPFTFDFKDCMATKHQLNAGTTSVGGYNGCMFYPTLNNSIFNSLPADLRAVIKPVTKLTGAGNASTNIVTTQEKLFLLSEVEIFGTTYLSAPGEGTQYAFFTAGGSRVKSVSAVASIWWARSPNSTNNMYFKNITATGSTNINYANEAHGIAAALCV